MPFYAYSMPYFQKKTTQKKKSQTKLGSLSENILTRIDIIPHIGLVQLEGGGGL